MENSTLVIPAARLGESRIDYMRRVRREYGLGLMQAKLAWEHAVKIHALALAWINGPRYTRED